ncbi:MAG: PQQ-binding-like beta-propeller repeat protein [Acidobacteriota bacterium]
MLASFALPLFRVRFSTLFCLLVLARAAAAAQSGWTAYNGGVNGQHFSPLTQINPENVNRLAVAWTYDAGEEGGLQTNPLIVGRTLYAYTPTQKVIALDATTGKLAWEFDPGIRGTQPARGLSWWSGAHGEQRLFAGVMNFLYCLDPATGKPVPDFGENGRIDLRKGLREPYQEQSIALTTPGVVYKDLIVVGGRDPETHPAPPGDIRAFDVRSGKLRWVFHTIPRPSEPGYATWPAEAWKSAGAANNWAGMSLDAERGILYVPTGSAVMDFYGGDRIGNDLYANCLLALDAATGKLLWYFQGVHHDIWDRDFPSPPALFTLQRGGSTIQAIAQTTKQGYLYLFDRLTGAPLDPVHEHPYPASTVPGEVTSPTQPLPDWPLPFAARQRLTEDMLTQRTAAAHAWAVKQFRTFRSNGQFYPFAVGKQTVIFPGFDGGAEWGGPAIDPTTNTLYVNANEMAWTGGLAPVAAGASQGASLYAQQCAVCHGVDRRGSPPAFPSLLGVGQRLTAREIAARIREGAGRMPAFPNLQGEALTSLIDYLRGQPDRAAKESPHAAPGAAADEAAGPYVFTGYRKFLDPDGYPAVAPPWGTLSAIDLNTGKYLWKIPLGGYLSLKGSGMEQTGSENYGGPVVTASGVLFIGATVHDRTFRAFDAHTGKLLWDAVLPFAGCATPATYMVDGRQYVVIAASGVRDPKGPQGAAYVAFALPK